MKELLEIQRAVRIDMRNARLTQPADCDPNILAHYYDWVIGLALEEAYNLKETNE